MKTTSSANIQPKDHISHFPRDPIRLASAVELKNSGAAYMYGPIILSLPPELSLGCLILERPKSMRVNLRPSTSTFLGFRSP